MLTSKTNIGVRDRRIVIQELTNAPDEYNQPIPTWSTFATVWASIDDKSGKESYQADQLTATRNTVFNIRYLSGLRETMRILYNNRYYNIELIKSPDRDRSLEVTAALLDDPEEIAGGAFSSAFSSAYDTA